MTTDAEQSGLEHALLLRGAGTAQRIHDVLMEAEDLRGAEIEVLIIGCIMHAAGLAHHDELDLDDFLQLCAVAHRDVLLTKKEDGSPLWTPDKLRKPS
jgi:hypothetical protein